MIPTRKAPIICLCAFFPDDTFDKNEIRKAINANTIRAIPIIRTRLVPKYVSVIFDFPSFNDLTFYSSKYFFVRNSIASTTALRVPGSGILATANAISTASGGRLSVSTDRMSNIFKVGHPAN